MKQILSLVVLAAVSTPAWAAVVFQDNFEYADQAAFEAAWPKTGTNGMVLSTDAAHSPIHAAYSAGDLARRHYRNFGAEVAPSDANPLVASFWMNLTTPSDPWASSNGRQYCEVRAYSQAGFNTDPNNALQELVAIGIWNSTVVDPNTGAAVNASQTRFQARCAFGFASVAGGWIDLALPDAPTRTAGWHKFTIRIEGNGVHKFFVDDLLSGQLVDTTNANTYDAFILGSGVSSNPGANVRNAYYDDTSVEVVPEPASIALLALGALSALRRR